MNKKEGSIIPVRIIALTWVLIVVLATLSWYSYKPCADSKTASSLNAENKLFQDQSEASANSYITITGPAGTPVRASSKFSNLLNYITGENVATQADPNKVDNDSAFWKSKFREWREKMINNNIAPSPTNFMDIIELSEVVTEK